MPLCWLLRHVAADSLISVFSEASGCSSDAHVTYTLVAGTGLTHGQWLDRVERVRTHPAVDQSSAPGSMLVQCVGDADWMLSWCRLLDGACRSTLEDPGQSLPSSGESFRIAAEQVPAFRGGHCVQALGFHSQQRQHLKLRSPSDLQIPQHGACRAAQRALLEGGPAPETTTAAPQGPGKVFGVTLLVTAICIFVALVSTVAILNRVKEWGDPPCR